MKTQLDEVKNNCFYIEKGCKPMSIISLQNRFIKEAEEFTQSRNLYMYIEYLAEDWSTIYVYKHAYLINIIKNLPEHPQTSYEHWILGKACGYSDEAIGEFLVKMSLVE